MCVWLVCVCVVCGSRVTWRKTRRRALRGRATNLRPPSLAPPRCAHACDFDTDMPWLPPAHIIARGLGAVDQGGGRRKEGSGRDRGGTAGPPGAPRVVHRGHAVARYRPLPHLALSRSRRDCSHVLVSFAPGAPLPEPHMPPPPHTYAPRSPSLLPWVPSERRMTDLQEQLANVQVLHPCIPLQPLAALGGPCMPCSLRCLRFLECAVPAVQLQPSLRWSPACPSRWPHISH